MADGTGSHDESASCECTRRRNSTCTQFGSHKSQELAEHTCAKNARQRCGHAFRRVRAPDRKDFSPSCNETPEWIEASLIGTRHVEHTLKPKSLEPPSDGRCDVAINEFNARLGWRPHPNVVRYFRGDENFIFARKPRYAVRRKERDA